MDHKIINYLNSENCRYSWSKLTPQVLNNSHQVSGSLSMPSVSTSCHTCNFTVGYLGRRALKKWSVTSRVNWERELAGPWTTSIHDSQPGLESGSTNTITHKWIQRNKSRTYSWASNCKWFGDSTLEGNISRWKWSTVHQVHEWTSQLSTRRGLPRSES